MRRREVVDDLPAVGTLACRRRIAPDRLAPQHAGIFVHHPALDGDRGVGTGGLHRVLGNRIRGQRRLVDIGSRASGRAGCRSTACSDSRLPPHRRWLAPRAAPSRDRRSSGSRESSPNRRGSDRPSRSRRIRAVRRPDRTVPPPRAGSSTGREPRRMRRRRRIRARDSRSGCGRRDGRRARAADSGGSTGRRAPPASRPKIGTIRQVPCRSSAPPAPRRDRARAPRHTRRCARTCSVPSLWSRDSGLRGRARTTPLT